MSAGPAGDGIRNYAQLVREVRHDMNGPLTSVLGNVQLLLEDPAVTDADVRETLAEIETDIRRLAAMIRRLAEVQLPDGDNAAGA